MSQSETIKKRLEGLLHFMDVTAPDLYNRFADHVDTAVTEEELQTLETAMIGALKPPKPME